MNNDCKALIKSYKKLFYLTGDIVFFNYYRTMEKTNQPLYLKDNISQLEQDINL